MTKGGPTQEDWTVPVAGESSAEANAVAGGGTRDAPGAAVGLGDWHEPATAAEGHS